jgi:predicted nucleotidyltransferase
MAETTPELKRIIREYCAQLAEMGIQAQRALLFGSQLHGTAAPDSDIDLIVVSTDWERYNRRERLEILGIAAARILQPIQAQGFTPEEIAQQQISPFWMRIIAEQAVAV